MPAYRVSKLANGSWYYLAVTMHYGAPLALDGAIERLLAGRTAFIARDDLQGLLAGVDQKLAIAGR